LWISLQPHMSIYSALSKRLRVKGFEVLLLLDYHTTYNTDLPVSLHRARE